MTAWGLVAELVAGRESVGVPMPGLVTALALVRGLVLDSAQELGPGQGQQKASRSAAVPSSGRRPHGPKPRPHLPPRLLQEPASAPVVRQPLQPEPQWGPVSAREWASAPVSVSETPQPVARTS